MNVWVNLTCLTVLNNVEELVFDYIALGHSGFLITWESESDVTPNDFCRAEVFRFGFRIKNGEDINFSFRKGLKDSAFSSDDEYIINSLEENTLYEVIVEIHTISSYDNSSPPKAKYLMEMKTNWKTNQKPAKPDFEWELNFDSFMEVKWFPCGWDRNCHGKEAGSHFAVKLKPLDRRGEWKKLIYERTAKMIAFRHFLFGILFEMVVISINGDFETNSDPEEIFFMPGTSAVTSTEVVSLSNASILISWRPPKHVIGESTEYYVDIFYGSFSQIKTFPIYDSILNSENEILYSETTNTTKILLDKREYEWLKPGDTCTILITPSGSKCDDGGGLSTVVEYTLPVDKDD